jgi:hypothetical protein
MRALDTLLAAGLVLGLGACSDLGDPTTGSVRLGARPLGSSAMLGGHAALAALPAEAGEVVSVGEERRESGFVQTVTLAGDTAVSGSNHIRVEAVPRGHAAKTLASSETIEAELAERMPGVAMRVLPYSIASASGPIGVATGTASGGVRCAYAWQVSNTGEGEEGFGRFLARDEKAYSVRVRLCRGGVSEEQLVTTIQGLRLATATAARMPSGPVMVGSDALATAQGGAAYVPVAPAPMVAAAPVRRAPVTTGETRERKSAPSKTVAAASVARPATAPAPAASVSPTVVSSPIPLPSGG